SIQSHVVHGYVGNKSSVFPLQLLGFDVDSINSVQFSNHTGGYPFFKGEVLQGEELSSLVEGLQSNDLLSGYTHMLTGYIGSPSFLRAVIDVYRKLKKVNPDLCYVCDPVLGDGGSLYVPEANVALYREEVLPLATIITPNQFECELLSGIQIRTEEEAINACAILHAQGPQVVVITSCTLEGHGEDIVLIATRKVEPHGWGKGGGAAGEAGRGSRTGPEDGGGPGAGVGGGCAAEAAAAAAAAAAGAAGAAGGKGEQGGQGGGVVGGDGLECGGGGGGGGTVLPGDLEVYRMIFPRIPQVFTGTGDLMAALLLGWTHMLPGDLVGALERVAGTMKAVLVRTHNEG
ncbi:unnamed protein product, partial [Discosporangium mesarthrocarpum]